MSSLELNLPSGVTPEQVKLFVRLQQLETWLRELVYMEMKCNFAAAWWDKCRAALQRSKRPGFPAGKALERDKKHPHMATPEHDPLWFISLDSLLAIVFDRYFWRLFFPCLTTKSLVRAKFDELRPVRNRIAHARGIHRDDLRRVENVMRDLDEGFWKFCTSYNDLHPFIADYREDSVFRHFVGRMGSGYVKTPSGAWAHVANRLDMTMDMELEFGVRPFCRGLSTTRSARGKGVFYRATWSVAHTPRSFGTADILTATETVHESLLYFHINAHHTTITVTIPSTLKVTTIRAILEQFYYVCENTTGPSVIHASESGVNLKQSYEPLESAATALAIQWPHYVLPPTNPLTFLHPDNRCSFFEI